jgi:MoaA/NifB/PqqE/SkfB family radical SAM enzyme
LDFRSDAEGRIWGTGLLNPLFQKFDLLFLLYFYNEFRRRYRDFASWKGKRVLNLFFPPSKTRAQLRTRATIFRRHVFKIVEPAVFTFAVTYRCPFACNHCSARLFRDESRPELSTSEAKRIIDECLDMGVSVIAFTGGEPLVRSDIFELIRHVDKKKAVVYLFTNGLLLTDEVLEKLKASDIFSLFVSLDSPDPEEHDRLRGHPGLFQAALDGINRARAKGILVGISSYCGRSATARRDYLRMHELGRKLDVQLVAFFDLVPTGRLLHQTEEALTLDQHRELAEFTTRSVREGALPPIGSQSWQNSLEGYLSGIGCFAGYIQFYLSAYGDVMPCDFTPISVGNIRQESIRRIWDRLVRHPAYRHRSQVWRMQDPRFRELFIDPIPQAVPLPFPLAKLPRRDYRSGPADI